MNYKNILRPILIVTASFIVQGCAQKPNLPTGRVPATEKAVTDADTRILREGIEARNPHRLLEILRGEKIAQTLVSTFDERLKLAKKAEQVDDLLATQLYCKIQKVRIQHESLQEKLEVMAKAAYAGGEDSRRWFFQTVADFAVRGDAELAASSQALRRLVSHEQNICGQTSCLVADVKRTPHLKLDPLNNSAFAKFIKARNRAIATDAKLAADDLKPGTCFAKPSRQPNQVGNYDWKTRDWVGGVLQPGEFVFTYDDGPDANFTRSIRDTWAASGFTQPSFFWLSKNVVLYPDIVKELAAQGYSINSHSERHADLGNLAHANSPDDFNAVNKKIFSPELVGVTDFNAWKNQTLDREIIQAVATLNGVLGKRVYNFRLPYGSGLNNDLIGARFAQIDVDNFRWRVDSLDWQDTNPESIRDRVVAQMNTVKKGIILFHDVHPQSAEAAKLMVEFLKQNPNFHAVSLDKMPGYKIR